MFIIVVMCYDSNSNKLSVRSSLVAVPDCFFFLNTDFGARHWSTNPAAATVFKYFFRVCTIFKAIELLG